jgi:hypothetical protein
MATVDYAKIAASKIVNVGDMSEPPRYLFYARNKKGKTGLTATAPRCLILDPEKGTKHLNKDQPVWPVKKWDDINEAFKYLQTAEGRKRFDWVGVDGMTRMANMALRKVMVQQEERDLDRIPGQVIQKDYGKAGELVKGMLFNFHNLPQGIIYTAQERMEELKAEAFDTQDEDMEDAQIRFVPDLPKGVRSSLNAIVDCIGRIYVVKVEIKGEERLQRRLWIAPTDPYDTGYRSDFELPNYLKNPTVPKLGQLIKTGKVTRNG